MIQSNYIVNYKTKRFKDFIINILQKFNLSTKQINKILDCKVNQQSGLELYSIGLTHKSINELYNYEFYEWMGDSTANNCICWYLTKRFPQLKQPSAVKILARLKINLGSKKTFYQLSEDLNFWDFISSGEEQIKKNGECITVKVRQHRKKDLLEDTLEAFIGITQILLDQEYGIGTGFQHCYEFIKSLYDKIDISLKYTDLYDAKTRLKEMFDEWTTEESAIRFWKEGYGYGNPKNYSDFEEKLQDKPECRPLGNKKWSKQNIRATYVSEENGQELEFGYWDVNIIYKGVEDITLKQTFSKEIIIGKGTASKKDQAEQIACENAITYLNTDRENKFCNNKMCKTYTLKGIHKTIDSIYEEINKLPNKEIKQQVNFNAMKKDELIEYCRKHNIKKYSNKKKSDIIALILQN